MDRPDSTQGDRHDTLLFVRRAAGGDGDGVTHRHSGRIPLTLVLVVTLLYLSMRGWPQTSARDPHDAGTSGSCGSLEPFRRWDGPLSLSHPCGCSPPWSWLCARRSTTAAPRARSQCAPSDGCCRSPLRPSSASSSRRSSRSECRCPVPASISFGSPQFTWTEIAGLGCANVLRDRRRRKRTDGANRRKELRAPRQAEFPGRRSTDVIGADTAALDCGSSTMHARQKGITTSTLTDTVPVEEPLDSNVI